ncbi:hypothetical protein, partial [Flavobacterium sp. Arc2]|uniref:hypothetical protein n=1 Tax=Flavobacterium sp. Arc2 TaxID=3046685 RepID=UPI00352EA19A
MDTATLQETNFGVNFKQLCLEGAVARTHNSTFAIGGVSFSADSFVVKESSVLRTNFCAKKPAHRQSAKRQAVKKPPFPLISQIIHTHKRQYSRST